MLEAEPSLCTMYGEGEMTACWSTVGDGVCDGVIGGVAVRVTDSVIDGDREGDAVIECVPEGDGSLERDDVSDGVSVAVGDFVADVDDGADSDEEIDIPGEFDTVTPDDSQVDGKRMAEADADNETVTTDDLVGVAVGVTPSHVPYPT